MYYNNNTSNVSVTDKQCQSGLVAEGVRKLSLKILLGIHFLIYVNLNSGGYNVELNA